MTLGSGLVRTEPRGDREASLRPMPLVCTRFWWVVSCAAAGGVEGGVGWGGVGWGGVCGVCVGWGGGGGWWWWWGGGGGHAQ